MTSASSVAGQWSMSAHSWSIHEQKRRGRRKKTQKRFIPLLNVGQWVAKLDSFIMSQNLKMWQKGWGGWDGSHVLSVLTAMLQEKLPPRSSIPAHPIQHLAVWQTFDKFLEYFLSFACPNIQPEHRPAVAYSQRAVVWWLWWLWWRRQEKLPLPSSGEVENSFQSSPPEPQ